jgi:hypothetical protein
MAKKKNKKNKRIENSSRGFTPSSLSLCTLFLCLAIEYDLETQFGFFAEKTELLVCPLGH